MLHMDYQRNCQPCCSFLLFSDLPLLFQIYDWIGLCPSMQRDKMNKKRNILIAGKIYQIYGGSLSQLPPFFLPKASQNQLQMIIIFFGSDLSDTKIMHNIQCSKLFSMVEHYCEFCSILLEASDTIITANDRLFAFYDISKASAVQHILVCTKAHIQSALKVDDSNILGEMRNFGEKVLKQIAKERGVPQLFRFGFHLPPFTSIDHIHLHGFILPFTKVMSDKITYGKLLKSVEQVAEMTKYAKL